jgi:uncharacterized repeat protein (TIGR01451 family)
MSATFRRLLLAGTKVLNTLVVLSLLTSGIGVPAARAAQSQASGGNEATSPETRTLPTLTPQYYAPPQVDRPDRFSARPDEASSAIPPKPSKDQIEFTLTASPAIIEPGGQFVVQVMVQNNSQEDLTGLTFTDRLKSGLEFVPQTGDVVSYDSKKGEISYALPVIPMEQAALFSYTLRVTEFNANNRKGEMWVHSANLKSSQGGVHLTARTAFVVGSNLDSGASVAAVGAKGGWHSMGRFFLYVPENTIQQDSFVIATPKQTNGRGPALQFQLAVIQTDPLTRDALGNPQDQKVAVREEA